MTTPTPDVFDASSVSRTEAAFARAGFSIIPDLAVLQFRWAHGEFHARVQYMNHTENIRHQRISGLVERALRIRSALAPVDDHTTEFSAREAA